MKTEAKTTVQGLTKRPARSMEKRPALSLDIVEKASFETGMVTIDGYHYNFKNVKVY